MSAASAGRMVKPGTYLAFGDLQFPLHNVPLVQDFIKVVREVSPDGLLCTGDEMDLEQLGKWVQGQKGEFQDSIVDIMVDGREIMDTLASFAPLHVMRSNHTDRQHKYLTNRAPALAGLTDSKRMRALGMPDLSYASMMGYLDNKRITWHDRPWNFAEDLVLVHGDEGGVSGVPGMTAYNLSAKWQTGVVCGHTHRAAIKPVPYGYNSSLASRWAIETGHMMDVAKADYTAPAKAPSWTAGFVVIHVGRKSHLPVFVPALPGENKFDRRAF